MIGEAAKKNKKGATWTSRPNSPRINSAQTKARKETEVPRTNISPRRGASSQNVTVRERFDSYVDHHGAVLAESFQRLLRTPVATFMTVAVIAIALALPAGLYVLLKNVQVLSHDWDGNSQISLFLESKVFEEQGQAFSETLLKDDRIARTQFISREQALQEFIALSGFGGVLSELDENPLPAVIVVYPTSNSVVDAESLRLSLQESDSVELAQLDAEWVQRLHGMIALAERLVMSLAFGLAVAVLLVMTNTIRLAIESRKDEIIIVKLVGGTDSFVRRPFLYTGVWYGLGGGILAVILVQVVLMWLESPASELSSLYNSDFTSLGLGALGVVFVVFFSTMIGLLGAWMAVARHLSAIEPE